MKTYKNHTEQYRTYANKGALLRNVVLIERTIISVKIDFWHRETTHNGLEGNN